MKKTFEESVAELVSAPIGSVVLIRGYVNSAGGRRDVEAQLVPHGKHLETLREDLKILEDPDTRRKVEAAPGLAEFSRIDVLAALNELVASRKKSIAAADEKRTVYRGPVYDTIGGSVASRDGEGDAVYLRFLMESAGTVLPPPAEAKGQIPRAKRALAHILDLPSIRFIHQLKLAPGKYSDIQVFYPTGQK